MCVALAYMYADIVRSTNNQSKYFEQCLLKRSERHYIESQTLQRTRMLSRGPLFARTNLFAHPLHCQIRCRCPEDVCGFLAVEISRLRSNTSITTMRFFSFRPSTRCQNALFGCNPSAMIGENAIRNIMQISVQLKLSLEMLGISTFTGRDVTLPLWCQPTS